MKLKEYSPVEFNLHTVRITFMSGVYVGHNILKMMCEILKIPYSD